MRSILAVIVLATISLVFHPPAQAAYDNNDAIRDCALALARDRYGDPVFLETQQRGIDNFTVRGTVQAGRLAFTCMIDDGRFERVEYSTVRERPRAGNPRDFDSGARRQRQAEREMLIACREYARARIDAFGGSAMTLDDVIGLDPTGEHDYRLTMVVSADFRRTRKSFRMRCRVQNAEVQRLVIF